MRRSEEPVVRLTPTSARLPGTEGQPAGTEPLRGWWRRSAPPPIPRAGASGRKVAEVARILNISE